MTEIKTLAKAEMAHAAALDDLRAAQDVADRLAIEAWTRRQAKREEWARSVVATSSAEASRLAAEETTAARMFQVACADVEVDPRVAYLAWTDSRIARNVHRDRTVQARSILGKPQGDSGYPIVDTPNFADALSRALASEVVARIGEASDILQQEINELDA